MRKITILLTAMIGFGTVGGVLVFKMKRGSKYFTTATANGVFPTEATCPNSTLAMITEFGSVKCYVVTNNNSLCDTGNLACFLTAKLTTD